MESLKKFNDCYFYYYSTCTKGDGCAFRHEPLALGCETMCVQWQQGKCVDKHCKLRHMELRKNRKTIPCYWETQPGGCRKKHCSFQHKNPEARVDGIAPIQTLNKSSVPTVSAHAEADTPVAAAAPLPAPAAVQPGMVLPHELLWQQTPRPVMVDSAILGVLPSRTALPHDPQQQYGLPVDPLVVNFEEESDNESAHSSSPTKTISPESNASKDQELRELERIQAEEAALYSYDPDEPLLRTKQPKIDPIAPEKRTMRINHDSKYERLSLDEIAGRPKQHIEKRNSLDFKILSLDEIRARKTGSQPQLAVKRKLEVETVLVPNKVMKVVSNKSIVYKPIARTDTSEKDDLKRRNSKGLQTNTVSHDITKSTNSSKVRRIETDTGKLKCNRELNVLVGEIKLARGTKISDVILLEDDDDGDDVEVQINNPIELSDEDLLIEYAKKRVVSDDYSNGRRIVSRSEITHNKSTSTFMEDLNEDSSGDSVTPEIENILRSTIPDLVASCHRIDDSVLSEIDSLLNEDS